MESRPQLTPQPAGEPGAFPSLLHTIECCWLICPSGSVLHHGQLDSPPDDTSATLAAAGRTTCGVRTVLAVPGIVTRMAAPRCRRCCAATGMPSGVGSPKNDPACRRLLGLDAPTAT